MQVIPAVNCGDFECVKEKLKIISFLKSRWVHFDAADGKFTRAKTWNEPAKIRNPKSEIQNLQIEAHLMVRRPENHIQPWIKAGAKRIILPVEAITLKSFLKVQKLWRKRAETGLSIGPQTDLKKILPFLPHLKFIQFLAVKPGWAGQNFQLTTLVKIQRLKKLKPSVMIEADGGINLKTARLVKKAGAGIVISASYIFNSKNPRAAFQALKRI